MSNHTPKLAFAATSVVSLLAAVRSTLEPSSATLPREEVAAAFGCSVRRNADSEVVGGVVDARDDEAIIARLACKDSREHVDAMDLRDLGGQDSRRGEARRPARATANEVRPGDQPGNCQTALTHRSTIGVGAGGRSDSVICGRVTALGNFGPAYGSIAEPRIK